MTSRKRFGWHHEKRWTGGDLLSVWLFGQKLELHWNWNDKQGENRRAFVSFGWDYGKTLYGVLFQHYREGFEFDSHTDGPATNRAVTLVLNRATRGGEFYCDGPVKRWLGGRVLAFDGGKHKHGVTKLEEGSRTVLMFQRGRW